jgi:indolepyruvate ferredoxin oxidoreductase beta subunit
VGGADFLLAFEPAEAVRQLHFLSPKGKAVVCSTAVKPIGPSAGTYEGAAMVDYLKANVTNLTLIDGKKIMAACAKALNVALLGAAVETGVFPFDADAFREIIPETVPERFIEMNKVAFELGRRLYREYCQ